MPRLQADPATERRLNQWTALAAMLPTLTVGNRLYTLELLADDGPRTAEQLAETIGHSHSVIVSQVNSLKGAGMVTPVGGGLYAATQRGTALVRALAPLAE